MYTYYSFFLHIMVIYLRFTNQDQYSGNISSRSTKTFETFASEILQDLEISYVLPFRYDDDVLSNIYPCQTTVQETTVCSDSATYIANVQCS